MIRYISTFSLVVVFTISSYCQFFIPAQDLIAQAPPWAQKMYSDQANIIEVTEAYRTYYQEHSFHKNIHTKNYKFWKRMHQYRTQGDGSIVAFDHPEFQKRLIKKKKQIQNRSAGSWSLIGPIQTFSDEDQLSGDQTCVYSIDQSLTNPNVVFCGTEPGEVYKSNDGGDSWTNVSLDLQLPFSNSSIRSVAIHPTDSKTVLFSMQNRIYKSSNSGSSWEILHQFGEDFNTNFLVEKILFHPSKPELIFVASWEGLWRSEDGGQTWNASFLDACYDIEINPVNQDVVYALRENNNELPEFMRSSDFGESFSLSNTGFYTSSDPDRQFEMGRIAITPADPERIYAYLAGQSKEGDSGYIGVYRSSDGGQTWTLPNGPVGGPYSENHPNLASGDGGESDFFADPSFCALAVSDTDPDQLLIGGLNLWRSMDGGASFEPLGGYIDGPFNDLVSVGGFHVDQQEYKVINGTTWITNDGGIYRSDDFFNTENFEKTNRGVHSTDFWGFGSGWNQDILIGGLYHNGVIAYNETYGKGNFLALGGGEPSSGYVNPGEQNLVYSTDVGGVYIPDELGNPEFFSEEFIPNESADPLDEGYSDIVFHPQCYSVAFTAFENALWRTTNKGESFELLGRFGLENDFLTYIHISRSDPNIMYMAQRLEAQDKAKLWKSNDAGENWGEVILPSEVFKFMMLQVDPFDPERIYIATSTFDQPSLVYSSIDGGSSWSNISSPTLEGEYAKTLDYIPDTDGDLYLGTNLGVYYKNDSMTDWEDFSDGLPSVSTTQKSKPFYRDSKLRFSTTKGLWESPLKNRPNRPLAQIMVDRIETCAEVGSTFRFVDYSYLQHDGATWNWIINGGTASQTDTWFTDVTFDTAGAHDIILEITDDRGLSDRDTLTINIESPLASINILYDQENCSDVVSTDPLEIEDVLEVYPNPARNYITVNFNNNSGNIATLKLINVAGKTVYLEDISTQNHSIDISTLSAGTYWVKVEDSATIYYEKVIIF